MKEKNFNLKRFFYLITLLSMVILCNFSITLATSTTVDSSPPTECRISINANNLYTNNRFVNLELYANDTTKENLQVWLSNDGETGSVFDFEYNKTYVITDQNYSIGQALTSSNSTITTNTKNILRIENWPLSSINGTKKVYAVFRDAYGNKTSVGGLVTITVNYDLNGVAGTPPAPSTTVKNLAIYTPASNPPALNQAFAGWSYSSGATSPNFAANSLVTVNSSQTLYAVYKTIAVGDYVYYNIDPTKSFKLSSSLSGTTEVTLNMGDTNKFPTTKQLFKVIESSASKISVSPITHNQVFLVKIYSSTGYTNINTIIQTVSNLYTSDYSSSASGISASLMKTIAGKADDKFSALFAQYGFTGGTYSNYAMDHDGSDDGYVYGVYISKIGSYNAGAYTHGKRGNSSVSAYIYPVVVLKNTVRFSGMGTADSPYTLSMTS